MKNLLIEKTPNTPLISFDASNGQFKIEGRSIPENPGDFFETIINWLHDYFISPAQDTTLEVNLEYVNSGSSKFLLGIFRLLREKHEEGHNIQVNWYFEEDDESIEGLGEHYKSTLQLPFKMVEFI